MGWREMIARRRRKEDVEDARFPRRMRTAGYARDDTPWLFFGVSAVILSGIGVQLWIEHKYVWFGGLCAMALVAAGFAWANMRSHRSRSAKDLREESVAESEADGVHWEE